MLVIINYNLGNPGSVANMFKRLGIAAAVSRDPEIIGDASRLVLGGVGAFDHGMSNIDELGLRAVLDRKVRDEQVPVVGLCLAMQLMTRRSEEGFGRGSAG
jgi:glutamine amidotransferase